MGDALIVLEGWLIKHADSAQDQGDGDSNPLNVWLARLCIHAIVIGVPARYGQVHVRFAGLWKHRDVVKQLLRRGRKEEGYHDQGVYSWPARHLPHLALQKDLRMALIR